MKFERVVPVSFQLFRRIFVAAGLFSAGVVHAQSGRPVTYTAEFGGLYSLNNRAPFWIRSNQFGILPDSGNTFFFRHSLYTKEDTSKRGLRLNAGLEMVTMVGEETRFLLPEAFVSARLGKFQLLVGRKKQIHGFTDTTLSSGSVTWSGNALPLPGIQLSLPDYVTFFNGFLGVKGHYVHAWFGEQPYARNYYLHQKSLYGRLGRGRIRLHGGIMHHAQWGGEPKYYIPEEGWLTINERFASGWNVYRDVVLPFHNPPRDSATVASFDFENRYGNHLGQIDIGGELNTANTRWLFYKQLPFETGQTFSSLGNLDDGVYGISVASKQPEGWLQRVVVEFVHTTNQGMYRSGLLRLLGFKGRHYGRNQNFYFSHAQYPDGWSYRRKSLGSPFLVPNPDIRDEKSINASNYFANNNNIKAGYLGLITRLSAVEMETRISFSKNYGTGENILHETADQLSFVHKMTLPIPQQGGFIQLNVGIDHGDLIKDNYGIMLSWKKVWE